MRRAMQTSPLPHIKLPSPPIAGIPGKFFGNTCRAALAFDGGQGIDKRCSLKVLGLRRSQNAMSLPSHLPRGNVGSICLEITHWPLQLHSGIISMPSRNRA